jgi:hypothetical protein
MSKMGSLKIDVEDYNLFLSLTDTDKIFFVSELNRCGTEFSSDNFIDQLCTDSMEEESPIDFSNFMARPVDDDNTIKDEIVDDKTKHKVLIIFRNENIYINSNKLAAIKVVLNKLFSDGYILKQVKTKTRTNKLYKYNRQYIMVSIASPLCFN